MTTFKRNFNFEENLMILLEELNTKKERLAAQLIHYIKYLLC